MKIIIGQTKTNALLSSHQKNNKPTSAKLTKWKAYNSNKSEANFIALKAEIYELYCHEIIFKTSKANTILFPNYNKSKRKKDLRVAKNGKILLCNKEISLAEFDIIGMNQSSILWYEVTSAKNITGKQEASYRRKKHMLQRIFPDKEILLTLIVPKLTNLGTRFQQQVIEEPDFFEYAKEEAMPLDIDVKRCLSFEEFLSRSKRYDYIGHIKEESVKYFNGDSSVLKRIKREGIIERLYDYCNMNYQCYDYFDIQKNQLNTITSDKGKIFKDGEVVSRRKKAYFEIVALRKMRHTDKKMCQ